MKSVDADVFRQGKGLLREHSPDSLQLQRHLICETEWDGALRTVDPWTDSWLK